MNSFEKVQKLYCRLFPTQYWKKLNSFYNKKGLLGLHLILSFDCDTAEDIAPSLRIASWLREKRLPGTFAVPGDLLVKSQDAYKQIAEYGFDFINHGGESHVTWIDDHYESSFFYNKLTRDIIKKDIVKGHETVSSIIGKTPIGFRTPHFGHFQTREELLFLHTILRQMDYLFSTSTVPLYAIKYSPINFTQGLFEIPVSGTFNLPYAIFDSWSNIKSPKQVILKKTYLDLFRKTVDSLLHLGFNGVLNYYVDPAHTEKNDVFIQSIQYAIDKGAHFLDYKELIKLCAE